MDDADEVVATDGSKNNRFELPTGVDTFYHLFAPVYQI